MRIVTPETGRALRLRQGVILLVGAAVEGFLVGHLKGGFFYTPLLLGLTYLLGAMAGGRAGSYWATAVTLVGWGAAVLFVRHVDTGLDSAGLYLAGAGLGACVGVLLGRRGFSVDPLGITATLVVAGALLTFEPKLVSVLGDAHYYALFLAVVGVANLLFAAFTGPSVSGEPATG